MKREVKLLLNSGIAPSILSIKQLTGYGKIREG